MNGLSARDLSAAESRDLALRYLGRREYGVAELKRKLKQRGIEPAMADEVVSALARDELVSDQRFTQMYIRMRVRLLFGPLKIRGELSSRGITDAVISENLPAEETWSETALQWAGKKNRKKLDYAGRATLYRSLLNRGFTHEQANVALQRLIPRE